MYRFSRAIYRDLHDLLPRDPRVRSRSERVLLISAEQTIERLAKDARCFSRPAHQLFREVRGLFPVSAQLTVFEVIDRHLTAAAAFIQEQAQEEGAISVLRCRATTRKGKACQRIPLPGMRYCPSHKHLERAAANGLRPYLAA
jgi:hypothetical protein